MIVDDVIPIKVRQERVKMSPAKRDKVFDAYKNSFVQLQTSPSPLSTRDILKQQPVSRSSSFIVSETLPSVAKHRFSLGQGINQ